MIYHLILFIFLAHIPLFLYPFLHTTSKTRPFEYLRLTSLGVVGALVKVWTTWKHYIITTLFMRGIKFWPQYTHFHSEDLLLYTGHSPTIDLQERTDWHLYCLSDGSNSYRQFLFTHLILWFLSGTADISQGLQTYPPPPQHTHTFLGAQWSLSPLSFGTYDSNMMKYIFILFWLRLMKLRWLTFCWQLRLFPCVSESWNQEVNYLKL